MGATKRKWIVLQPEVRNHMSLWYVQAHIQTNRPYSFLKHAHKILGNIKLQKLKKKNLMNGSFSLSFVSCQLVPKFILITAGFRKSSDKTEKETQTRLRWIESFFWRHGPSNNCHVCSKLGVKCLCGTKLFNLTLFRRLLNLLTTLHNIAVLMCIGTKTPTLVNNNSSAEGDFSVYPITFLSFL